MQLEGVEGPQPERLGLRLPVLALEVYEEHGGHTLRRHVYTEPGDALRRVKYGGVAAAGSFLSRDVAQHCVETAIRRQAGEVRSWLRSVHRFAPHTILQAMHEVTGLVLTVADVRNGLEAPRPVTGVFVVLRRRPELPGGYLVLTAYPRRIRQAQQ